MIDVDEEAVEGVAVADMVQESRAPWGWELVDELLELCVPGGVRRPGLGPALTALSHWIAPVCPVHSPTMLSPGCPPVGVWAWKSALLSEAWPTNFSGYQNRARNDS
jgi:hypothetical protein